MRTSNWIKFIGILCIAFGAIGIINEILFFLLPEMIGLAKEKLPEVSPDLLRWIIKLPYLNLLAYTIYLMAGIFFLMKKPFSLIAMYIALIFSILCIIVPMLFFSQYSSIPLCNYEINIFSLIGPFIDLALLFGVYRLEKYYYKSDDELIKMLGGIIRITLNPQLMKILSFVGLLCLFVPLSIMGLWIYSFNLGTTQADSVAIFESYFPAFLNGQYAIAYLSIFFSILAIIISSINLKSKGKLWKSNMIILILSTLLLLLNIFQMM